MVVRVRRAKSPRCPAVGHRAACRFPTSLPAHGSPAAAAPDRSPAARSVRHCSKKRYSAHSPYSSSSMLRVRLRGRLVPVVPAFPWVGCPLSAALPSFPPCVCVWFHCCFEIIRAAHGARRTYFYAAIRVPVRTVTGRESSSLRGRARPEPVLRQVCGTSQPSPRAALRASLRSARECARVARARVWSAPRTQPS